MRFTRGHHGIYVPVTRDIIAPPLVIGIKGRYKVELIDAATGKVKRKLEFDNLIVNGGMDALGSGSNVIPNTLYAYCGVGTGNTTPANTDTALVAEILPRENNNAGIGDTKTYQSGSPDFIKFVTVRQFATTEANGNLTEIGFFGTPTGGTMFSRQLIKDGVGNPTTLTKTSSDQLRITYEIDVYPPQTDAVFLAQNISGTNYDITGRAQNVSQANCWLNLLTNFNGICNVNATAVADSLLTSALTTRTSLSTPAGTTAASSRTNAAYTNGSFQRDITDVWNTATGNGTWVTVGTPCTAGTTYLFGWGLSPSLVKNSTQQLTWNYRVAWARH